MLLCVLTSELLTLPTTQDAVVYDATSGGVTAAVSAARNGLKTALICASWPACFPEGGSKRRLLLGCPQINKMFNVDVRLVLLLNLLERPMHRIPHRGRPAPSLPRASRWDELGRAGADGPWQHVAPHRRDRPRVLPAKSEAIHQCSDRRRGGELPATKQWMQRDFQPRAARRAGYA